MEEEVLQVYLCPRCLTASDTPGRCGVCGTECIRCRPGDPDDPCRRPLMDSLGRVQTRAPVWWLRHTVSSLTHHVEGKD